MEQITNKHTCTVCQKVFFDPRVWTQCPECRCIGTTMSYRVTVKPKKGRTNGK